jgi:HTH-type transcriptional regulator/antitoxin MqsA
MELQMAKTFTTCPFCNEAQLAERVEKNPVEYKYAVRELDLFYSVCSACGGELSDASQIRKNKRLMTAFKKEVDGLLTGAEVRGIRESLGISQMEAARIFGGGPVAFSKYESDDINQSEGMDKLLRVARAVPQAYAHLRKLAGLSTLSGSRPTTKLSKVHTEPSR